MGLKPDRGLMALGQALRQMTRTSWSRALGMGTELEQGGGRNAGEPQQGPAEGAARLVSTPWPREKQITTSWSQVQGAEAMASRQRVSRVGAGGWRGRRESVVGSTTRSVGQQGAERENSRQESSTRVGKLHGGVMTGDDGTRAGELNREERRRGSSTTSREGKRAA
jgi:hypothetical protein